MTTKSLVSVIIPSYNAAEYVKEAVDSALRQTYSEVEVVVVDDGSTDKTKQALAPYIGKKQIKYIYQDNKGLAGARNTGIKNSSGEYIAFLDADDLFLPEKIEEQVRIFEDNRSYGVCYSDLLHFDEVGNFYHHRYKYPSGNIFEPLLHRQFMNPLTVMVRKEIFDQYGYFDEKLHRSEDWDLWLRWACVGVKFYYLDKPLAHYRIRSIGNLSSVESEPEMKERNLEIFTRVGDRLSAAEWQAYGFSRILKKLKLKTAVAYLMVGDRQNAVRFAEAMPFGVQTFIRIVPTGWWRWFLGTVRKIRHRMLLKKIKLKK